MKNKLIYSIAVLALILAAAPASAGAKGVRATLTASTTVRVDAERGILKKLLDNRGKKNDDERGRLSASSTVRVKAENRNGTSTADILKIKTRADREIDRRIRSLTELSNRVNEMKKVSDSQKSALTATIQAEITKLTDLKAKIDADTDITVLRTDVESITNSFRTYVLIMPRITILAAADRINVIVGDFAIMAAKLQTRIAAAQSAGKDVSASVLALADLNAKTADATIQAAAAVSGVSSLTPDDGDKAEKKSNNAALKMAREKIRAAEKDLKAARKDVEAIIKGTKGFGAMASSTATTTTP